MIGFSSSSSALKHTQQRSSGSPYFGPYFDPLAISMSLLSTSVVIVSDLRVSNLFVTDLLELGFLLSKSSLLDLFALIFSMVWGLVLNLCASEAFASDLAVPFFFSDLLEFDSTALRDGSLLSSAIGLSVAEADSPAVGPRSSAPSKDLILRPVSTSNLGVLFSPDSFVVGPSFSSATSIGLLSETPLLAPSPEELPRGSASPLRSPSGRLSTPGSSGARGASIS
mmetsp:Transcript_25410/g.61210  ORF Transcript_25410/g.61210 Transcript_25410/m.61210 type:complete len:225 (+) Transcript_25410:2703-3377(+)